MFGSLDLRIETVQHALQLVNFLNPRFGQVLIWAVENFQPNSV